MPKLPPLAAHLWIAFHDLSRTRGAGGMGGPNPLTRLDLRLWQADEGKRLDPWERRAILDIDQAWLGSVAEQMRVK